MITYDEVIEFIHNPLAYEQNLVSKINIKGEQIPLNSFNELYSSELCTIKIEGMERFSKSLWEKCCEFGVIYNHIGPVTCHVFIAHKDSPSFDMHTDPDNVIIYCCHGTKTLIINEKHHTVKEGEYVYIPANTPHKALNEFSAVTLSFGLEKFLKDKALNYELGIISKDH